jgi:predicted nucleotidyltransferase
MDIEKLKQFVSSWASSLDSRVRIYFYGSHLTGNNNPESDYDLAIEFLDAWVDTTLAWFDYHDQWQSNLSKITKSKIHLELYDDENVSVKKYVKEKSIIIFESPEVLENDDTSSLKPPAVLLNIELCDD